MPKLCCIANCGSKYLGRGSGQRKLFGVPKDAERKKLWLDAITPYFRERAKSRKDLYVCDLHFHADDILHSSSILLKNGTTHIIPRLPAVVKPSSVPSIFNNNDADHTNVSLPVVTNKIGLEDRLASDENEVVDLVFEGDRNEGPFSKGEKVTGTTKVTVSDPKEPMKYNLRMLEDELKKIYDNKEIHTWGRTRINSGFILSYYGRASRKIETKTILVKEDMTLEIRNAGKIYMKYLKKKIMCVADILSVMAEVEKKNPCQGVDEDNPCPNDFLESSSTSSCTRCISCRINRRQKLNNLRRIEKRSILKEEKTKKLVKNLKRQNALLLKTIASVRKGTSRS